MHPIKVALTGDQVKSFGLPPVMRAKKSSANYEKFAGYPLRGRRFRGRGDSHRQTCSGSYKRQSIPVLDIEVFNAEIDAEREDAAWLQGIRETVKSRFADVDFERPEAD